MSMMNDRKLSYKLPPTTIREKFLSQEARRSKALEEQKRRRAQRVDSTRQLDLFASLNINDSDEDDDLAEEDDSPNVKLPPSAAIGPYAAMLNDQSSHPSYSAHSTGQNVDILPDTSTLTSQVPVAAPPQSELPSKEPKKRSKRKNKKRGNNYNKPSKWADQCMYAELLEMSVGDELWSSDSMGDSDDHDSLPKDLETGWVAVAPVPVGKRCLVVTHQSAGLGGVVPNTTLRSRLLGKSLIPRFPSPLPPLTVLDCVLDANWRDNGIIHVLDVVRWKGQDIGDCEAPFRFWWRDTRLGELSQAFKLPSTISFLPRKSTMRTVNSKDAELPDNYQFPYPTYFIPVPYHTNTSLNWLDCQIIPDARLTRSVVVEVPMPTQQDDASSMAAAGDCSGMDVEIASGAPLSSSFTFRSSSVPSVILTPVSTEIQPDGLLLYVSEASYEPGTSPLSNWVPITNLKPEEKYIERGPGQESGAKGPLDSFHSLVRRRLLRRQMLQGIQGTSTDAAMDMEAE